MIINAENLFVTGRRPANVVEEPTILVTSSKVDKMFRREKEKPSVSSICMDLKPPDVVEVVVKPYWWAMLLHV